MHPPAGREQNRAAQEETVSRQATDTTSDMGHTLSKLKRFATTPRLAGLSAARESQMGQHQKGGAKVPDEQPTHSRVTTRVAARGVANKATASAERAKIDSRAISRMCSDTCRSYNLKLKRVTRGAPETSPSQCGKQPRGCLRLRLGWDQSVEIHTWTTWTTILQFPN